MEAVKRAKRRGSRLRQRRRALPLLFLFDLVSQCPVDSQEHMKTGAIKARKEMLERWKGSCLAFREATRPLRLRLLRSRSASKVTLVVPGEVAATIARMRGRVVVGRACAGARRALFEGRGEVNGRRGVERMGAEHVWGGFAAACTVEPAAVAVRARFRRARPPEISRGRVWVILADGFVQLDAEQSGWDRGDL